MPPKFGLGTWVKTNNKFLKVAKNFNKTAKHHRIPLSVSGRVREIQERDNDVMVLLDSYPHGINQNYLEEWEINVAIQESI
jgi:hypothetical protein